MSDELLIQTPKCKMVRISSSIHKITQDSCNWDIDVRRITKRKTVKRTGQGTSHDQKLSDLLTNYPVRFRNAPIQPKNKNGKIFKLCKMQKLAAQIKDKYDLISLDQAAKTPTFDEIDESRSSKSKKIRNERKQRPKQKEKEKLNQAHTLNKEAEIFTPSAKRAWIYNLIAQCSSRRLSDPNGVARSSVLT